LSAEQAQAIIMGMALGDALGRPTEFMSLAEITAQFGAAGIREPVKPIQYTDDTQLALAVGEALCTAGHAPVDELMPVMGNQFVRWLNSPDNNRAPGQTCLAAMQRYAQGVPWTESGDPDSKGSGGPMRVALIGYFYQHDVASLREVAEASCRMTHGHSAAIAASIAAAVLVKLALDCVEPIHYLGEVWRVTDGLSEDFDQALRRVSHVLGWGSETAAMRHIGDGWVAEEAVALALYCVQRYPDDYVEAVCRAANSKGDSDTVACIAGAIAGARLGLASIPADWRAECENAAYLYDLGSRIAASRLASTAGANDRNE
jgi:ADP-ribosylglycohydrolase